MPLAGAGFKQDGHGTVVFQLDLHQGAKAAGGNGTTEVAKALDKFGEQQLGFFRRRGGGITGPVAAGTVAVERKLADDEQRAADIAHGFVEFALFVIEDAQKRDFAGQPLDIIGCGIDGNASENEQAAVNLTNGFHADADGGTAHALNDELHELTAESESFLYAKRAMRSEGRRLSAAAIS